MYTTQEKPTPEEQQAACESLLSLQALFDSSGCLYKNTVTMQIGQQDNQLPITVPSKAFALFTVILANMAEGMGTSIIPCQSELTTQQAADLLNVSRPYIVKLLEKGTIPCKKVGSHRRILATDLLAFEKKYKQQQADQLAFLAQQSQELNLGYE